MIYISYSTFRISIKKEKERKKKKHKEGRKKDISR